MAPKIQFFLFSYGGGCVQCGDRKAAELHKRLVGQEITLMAPGTVAGKYVGMELRPGKLAKHKLKGIEPIVKVRTSRGLQAVPVSLVQKVQLADGELQAELQEFTDALLASSAAKTIHFGGLDRYGEPKVLAGGPLAKAAGTGTLLPVPKCPIEFEHIFLIDLKKAAPASCAVYITNDLPRPVRGQFLAYEAGRFGGHATRKDIPADACCVAVYGTAEHTNVEVAPLSETRTLFAQIEGGILRLHRTRVEGTKFVITNATHENMPFFVEYPRKANWRLLDPQEWEDRTDKLWRFRFHVYKNAKRTVTAKEEQPLKPQSLDLRKVPARQLRELAEDRTISKSIRDALARVLDLKSSADPGKLARHLRNLNVY